jgi:hypothetical protein
MDFEKLCERAGYAVMPYSGRGMDGRYCLGIVVDKLQELMADLIECADPDETRELSNVVRTLRTDGMGFDIVVYFPGVPAPVEHEDEQ